MNYSELIIIDPNKRFGKPCIKGTRVTVYDVLSLLSNGMSHSEIIEEHPELSEESILACLAFAADKEHKYRIAS